MVVMVVWSCVGRWAKAARGRSIQRNARGAENSALGVHGVSRRGAEAERCEHRRAAGKQLDNILSTELLRSWAGRNVLEDAGDLDWQ